MSTPSCGDPAAHLPASTAHVLLGHRFFPGLIAPPFMDRLRDAFYVSVAMACVAAIASLLRGRQYFHEERPARQPIVEGDTAPIIPPRRLEQIFARRRAVNLERAE